jgi:hypothetical protein
MEIICLESRVEIELRKTLSGAAQECLCYVLWQVTPPSGYLQ